MASDVRLGVLLKGDEPRDAIHVAIAPVVAAQILTPGEHVGLVLDDESEPFRVGRVPDKIGIVDPYLKEAVMPHQRFWLFLYPQTITSLRHDWTHPAFVKAAQQSASVDDPVAASKRWIENFAVELDQTYNRLMSAAALWVEAEDYTHDNSETYKSHYDKFPEFWKHYEVVTGTKVKDKESSFFTCSC